MMSINFLMEFAFFVAEMIVSEFSDGDTLGKSIGMRDGNRIWTPRQSQREFICLLGS